MSTPYQLAGLELASAIVLGQDPATTPLEPASSAATPRAALEEVLVEALQRSPCVISFSGGRDSSGLLALAVHVAHAQGLAMPVAVTNFFPTDAASAESEWQEVVIRHIGPTDWERLKFTDELDVIGPVAQPALREWGPCFPFNGHFGLPAISLARHGCYLTGIGGDEVFQLSERNRLGAVLTGRERPGRRHLRTGALALLPSRARRYYYQRRMPELPWLKPDARSELKRGIAEHEARQPIWNAPDLLKDYWCDRRRLALSSTLDAYGAPCSTVVVHPFEDARFLRAVARARPRVGWLKREDAMRELFGDLLPDPLISRRSKANFSHSFFNAFSRRFVETWSGQGVDDSLIDAEHLLDTWRQPVPDARSYSLVQAAWCASSGDH
jgi:asparagine synthase (glutamine-hydrolysing)